MDITHNDIVETSTYGSPHVQKLANCGLALQVASVEWANSDIDDTSSIKAFEEILKQAQKALKLLKIETEN